MRAQFYVDYEDLRERQYKRTENCIAEYYYCILPCIIGRSVQGEYDGWDVREMTNGYKLLVRKAKGIDKEIILKLIVRKQGVMVWDEVT